MRAASFAVVALAALVSMFSYGAAPAVMAVHWNAYGQADGFAPKALALALMPAIMLVLFAVLAALRVRAPNRAYDAVALAAQVFMLCVHGTLDTSATRGFRSPSGKVPLDPCRAYPVAAKLP